MVEQLAPQVGERDARAARRHRRIGATAAAALVSRALSMVLALATVPLTLNYLGPERFGIWVTISAVIAILALTDLGIANGLLNALTQSLAHGKTALARRQIASAMLLLAGIAATLAAGFALTVPVIPWADLLGAATAEGRSEVTPAVLAWVLCFLLGLPMSVAVQVRWARQEGYIAHLVAAAGNLAAFVALVGAIAARQGLPVLVLSMAGPPLLVSAAHGLFLFGRTLPGLRPTLRLAERRVGIELLRAGILFFVIQVSMALAFTSDTLILTAMIGPVAAAEYGVVGRLFMIPAGIVAIVLSALWPAYGEAAAVGDVIWIRRALGRSLGATLSIALPAAVLLIAFAQPIIESWAGSSVTPPPALVLGFGVWVILSAIGSSIAMLLNGVGEIRVQAAWAMAMAAANVALSVVLTDAIGTAGVIWGTVLSYGALTIVPLVAYVPRVLARLERPASATRAAMP